MSRLWHGYVAFQKPAAVSAGNWINALNALKAELDETPTASQPAERWHSVVNGTTTIAEATFDLYKLNTSNLSTVAGVDMTDAWEMLRPLQTWGRSKTKAHSLVDDRGWDLAGYTVFLPEDYGTVDGDPANDTAAVQAAVDAAIANGEGRVVCNGTYHLDEAGQLTAALLGTVNYGILVNGDNVGIEGSGTFVLDAGVSYSNPYVAILFGNGGSVIGLPGEDGTWCYNNWLKDVTIDGSALSDADRIALSINHVSYTVVFDYCQDWYIRNLIVVDGWGGNGTLGSAASSRYGYVSECDIQSAVSGYGSVVYAFWFDGARYVLLINNQSATDNAFTFQANLDNCNYASGITSGFCQNNCSVHNVFTELASNARISSRVWGSDDTEILDNSYISADGSYIYPIQVGVYTDITRGTATSNRVTIRGNTLTSTLTEKPITIQGAADDLAAPGTTPVYIEDLVFADNIITGLQYRGWFENAYCRNAIFSGNTYPGGTTNYGYTHAEDEAEIVANNTLQ